MRQLLSLCLLALFCIIVPLHGIKLNSNGGYEVTVVIDENDADPGSNYVDNIKESFRKLSHLLYKSTKETFFIQNLNLVIPPSWDIDESILSDEPAMASLSTADVRISNQTKFPYVINPNPCLNPGDFISLPASFFSLSTNGPYGQVEKALLVEFARYRFGVWEEHGIPGHRKFPYFYKPEVQDGPVWHATGCNNARLNGTYQADDGSICDADWEGNLNEECRFIPDRTVNSEITSSLMHFHWLESVTEFCDETTHNRNVPNKQNYFCNYRSVMETIEASVDYQQVEEPVSAVPILRTKIQRPSNLPVLYVLLDRGHFNVDNLAGIINVAQTAVSKLVGTTLNKETIAAVGAFPSSSNDEGVAPLVTWKQIQGNENEFIDAIADVKTNGPENRDFAHAIIQASELINEASPVNGGIILLVKTGVPADFRTTPYEKQVETTLLSHGTRLYAIEVNGFNETAQNLRQLANTTSGVSAAISRPALSTEVSDLLNQVEQAFNPGNTISLPTLRSVQIVFEQDVNSGDHVIVPVVPGTETVTFTLVHSESTTNASVGVDTTTFVTFTTPVPEWENDENDTTTRFRSSGLMIFAVESNVTELIFVFTSPTNTSGHLIVTASGNDLEEDYDIRVFTTALENVLDFNKTGDSYTPFVISAQVTKGDKPVIGVVAEVTLTQSSVNGSVTTITLKDDGLGTPDVGENDGIYSAVVIPDDGVYSITVMVKTDTTFVKSNTIERSFGGLDVQSRLLPIDQGEGIGCGSGGCESIRPPTAFTKTFDVVGTIEVKNRNLFVHDGKPVAIRDLTLAKGSLEHEITINFTSVEILGRPSNVSPTLYALYMAPKREDLIGLDLSAPLPQGVENPINYTSPSFPPGQAQSREFSSTRSGLFYFTLVGVNGNTFGAIGQVQSTLAVKAPIEETTTEDNQNSSTDKNGEPEENKSWIKSTGGIITIIVIVLVVFGVAIGGFFYMKKRRTGSASTSQLTA